MQTHFHKDDDGSRDIHEDDACVLRRSTKKDLPEDDGDDDDNHFKFLTVAASLFPMTLTFLSFRVAASLDKNGNVLYMPNHRCIK